MNMEGISPVDVPLFPVLLRQYQIERDINAELIEAFAGYPAQQSNIPEGVITSRPDLHKSDNLIIDEMCGFFETCLEEYRMHHKLFCDKLDISLCWFNHAPANSGYGHPLHRHPMSYVSAVYYVTEGAPTFFEDPCTPRTYDTLDVFKQGHIDSDWGINEKVDAEPGKLIIFPSWLKHYSGRQMETYDRWTVSFNAFPTGRVNMGPWETPQLNVKLL